MSDKPRSFGRKSISASLQPRELMTHSPRLSGIWTARIITLFPEAFPGVLGESLTGRVLQDGLWQLQTFDLREYGIGTQRNVDDTPAGGGAGAAYQSYAGGNGGLGGGGGGACSTPVSTAYSPERSR